MKALCVRLPCGNGTDVFCAMPAVGDAIPTTVPLGECALLCEAERVADGRAAEYPAAVDETCTR